MASKQYRALTNLSLRQSSDPQSPLYEQWHEWPEGSVFTPPKHMNVDKALERGIVALVDASQQDEAKDG